MQRRILGCCTVFLLLGAAVLGIWWPEAEVTLACCWRGGAIMAAAWLAYDDVQRLPNWFLLISPVLLIVLIRWSKLLLLLIPVLVLYAVARRIFRPLGGKNRS